MLKKILSISEIHLLWQISTIDYFFKHVDQIIELSMDISDNNHWLLHSKDVRLLSHDGWCSFDYLNELFLLQSTLSQQMLSKFINIGNCTVAALAFSSNNEINQGHLLDTCQSCSLVMGYLAIGGTSFITLSPSGSDKSSMLLLKIIIYYLLFI